MADFNYDQPFVVVGGLIEKDSKFLLVHESHGPYKGLWNIPGGKWDAHESILDGATREVLEETGYRFAPKKLLGAYARHKTNSSTLQFIFVGDISVGQGDLKGDVDEIRWFSEEEIMAMGKDTLRGDIIKQFIHDYRAGHTYPFDFLKGFRG